MRSRFLVPLILGLAIRIPTIFVPLNEGHRNAQTAVLTAGMFENGALRLDPIAPWRGDLQARLVQELPVYNLTTLVLQLLPGVSLDMAGRLTSLIFWAISFVVIQALWRSTIPPGAKFWANLLFIVSPMNWYLSTAFMPESLLQLLAIGFMVSVLDYTRKHTWGAFAGFFVTGLLGLLIKFPSFVHLGLFAAFVFMDREGWKFVFRPCILAGVVTVIATVLAWGAHVRTVNIPYFQDWSGWHSVVGFIRPEVSRLSLGYYLPLAGYNFAFIVPLVAVPFLLFGIWYFTQTFRSSFSSRVWIYLLGSLIVSWLVWGKGAPAQGYYNLPNLVLFCAAFGQGVSLTVDFLRRRNWQLGQKYALLASLAFLLFLFGMAGHLYLNQPDTICLSAAQWLKNNTKASDLIIYQPRHSPAVVDYQHQPLLSHLSGRRTWIWTRNTPDYEKHRALATSTYAIVTKPTASPGPLELLRRKFKGTPSEAPTPLGKQNLRKLSKVFEDENFEVLALNKAAESQ